MRIDSQRTPEEFLSNLFGAQSLFNEFNYFEFSMGKNISFRKEFLIRESKGFRIVSNIIVKSFMDFLKSGNISNDQYKKCGFVWNYTVKYKTLIKIISIIQ